MLGGYLRSKSQRLGACSVGLRRSEIDGYFLSDRKFSHDIAGPLLTFEITAIGWFFGRDFVAISVPEM